MKHPQSKVNPTQVRDQMGHPALSSDRFLQQNRKGHQLVLHHKGFLSGSLGSGVWTDVPLAPIGDRVVVERSEQGRESRLELPLPDPLAAPHRLPHPPAAHAHAGDVPGAEDLGGGGEDVLHELGRQGVHAGNVE